MDRDSDHDADASTKKPKLGGFKETTRRLRQGKENHLSNRASLDWRQDRERVCGSSAISCVAEIEDLKALLARSRTGEVLLKTALEKGLQIRYDAQTAQSQFYPRADIPVIVLNPHRPQGELLNMLARELRRAWQHFNGALVNPMCFEPDEAVLVNRAQQADVFMMSVKIAWELKLVNESEAWDSMIGSPVAPVTRVFEMRAQQDFRSLNNGEAARAAYDKFFEGSCTKMHDKRIIHQMLLDDIGYMRASKKQPRASAELFRKLGEMPHGANYLSMRSKHAPTDMCYSTVEDRSNANFLWFIKFERSFQEKEAQMLRESVRVSAEIVDFAAWSLGTRTSKPVA
jgi:hypothetical protein